MCQRSKLLLTALNTPPTHMSVNRPGAKKKEKER